MDFWALIVCAATGLATTLVLIPIIIRRRGAKLVAANAAGTFHHTHKTPVSRLGGLALAAAFVVVALVGYIWFAPAGTAPRVNAVIIISSLAMFGLGLWDDLHPLGARKKLAGQIVIAAAVCYFGVQIEIIQNPLAAGQVYHVGLWGWLITIFWLVALTNMINLIDGIDGLAGGIALMLMGLLAFARIGAEPTFPILSAAGMIGALLGFLRYNFPPAKIYMGDGGAYFLGFLIAILTLVHSQKGTIAAALIAPLFALALPIVDVSLAILRRGLRGLPIFRPDRKHLHHKLQEIGFSRTRTVLILYGFSAVFLLMAFGVFWSQGRWIPILFGFMCLLLLLSARSFNFSRDWFAVGRVLEDAVGIRRETQYALALTRWLELEAERAVTVEGLWTDFAFVAGKLGFQRVQLKLAGCVRTWQSPEQLDEARSLRCAHEMRFNGVMTLEFVGDTTRMSQRLFEHLSELAAEGWLKAATRWQTATKLPLQFSAPSKPPAQIPG
jgi:UDP-GlcNAc:undecaprenyl-phosphate GlcNAc-1-phosphate transferase